MNEAHATAPAVAVVGMGCRFPQANGVRRFWQLLTDNTDAITPVPADRFDIDRYASDRPGSPGRTVSRHGGFIDGLFGFDADFFGISPREAEVMDPQQRLLLQVVWEALEEAGIRPSSLAGSRTGVFVGQATADYSDVSEGAAADVRTMAGARLRSVTAGRVSFALDLRGPSLVLDTACSSSLVAVHTARQSLLTGESDLAIAAGVNAILSPVDAIAYSQGGMLAPDGRCKFADRSADGFVRSEGVGVVLLKRLPDALRDGDEVLALLLGSAVTNDGRGSGLLLQPAVSGQAEMLRAACRSAGIAQDRLDYVEAHGTGTSVGDGVELRALAEALRPDGSVAGGRPLRVGSVKGNIGHAEAAAGIAGLIKAVLITRNSLIPASLHHGDPHPLLAEDGLPVEVVRGNTPLAPAGDTALLGVSSFGIAGTNAHVVLGGYRASVPPTATAPGTESRPHLLVLSARTPEALRRTALRYAGFLEPAGFGRELDLRDICRTAAFHRDAHPYRLWATGPGHDELAAALRTLAQGDRTPDGGVAEAGFDGPRGVALVFPGQGSQWLGMGRELLASSETFRTALAACDTAVRDELGWSVTALLTEEADDLPDRVDVVQALLWAMEVALAELLRSAGVEPALCLGHSMGETAAACVTGALSLRDAAAVICRRSRLMQRLAGRGAMLATGLSAEEARRLLAPYGDRACVAAENAPEATVLAGDPQVLDALAQSLEATGVFCRPVTVNVASHTPGMEELRADLTAALCHLTPRDPRTTMFSTTRCAPVNGPVLDAGYWMDNLRLPVRFVESARTVVRAHDPVFVEVSPHPVLVQAIRDTQAECGVAPAAVPLLVRRQGETTALARAVGSVFCLGGDVDWRRWFGGAGRRVPLPTYAWDEQVFRARTRPAEPQEPFHVREFGPRELGLAALGEGVRVHGAAVVPPAVYFATVAETAREALGAADVTLEDIAFHGDPVDLAGAAQDGALRVELEPVPDPVNPVERGAAGAFAFCAGPAAGGTQPRVTGTVRRSCVVDGARDSGHRLLDGALSRCTEYLTEKALYDAVADRGYGVAPALRTAVRVWRRDGEAVAQLSGGPADGSAARLEAAFLTLLAAGPDGSRGEGYLPVSFGSVRMAQAPPLPADCWAVTRCTPTAEGRGARCAITVLGPDGHILVEAGDVALRALAPGRPAARSEGREQPRGGWGPSGTTGHHGREDPLVHVAAVLGASADRLDLRMPLADMGLDSLMANQLRARLRQAYGVDLPLTHLLARCSAADVLASLRPRP